MTVRRTLTGFSVLIIAAMLGIAWWAWGQLPPDARIAIHWGLSGEPDGFAGRASLFFLPGFATVLACVLYALPALEPRKVHFLQSSKFYAVSWGGVMTVLAMAQLSIVLNALDLATFRPRAIILVLGVLFMVLGNYLSKTRSNFMMGVRTPWTLSSELSWRKSNRLAAWIMVAWGFATLVVGFVAVKAFLPVLIAGIVALLAVPLPYSYFVWRSDPDRPR